MGFDQISVLLVEDNLADGELLKAALFKRNTDYLAETTYKLFQADTLSQAVRIATEETIDIILLDLALPDTIGLSALITLHKIAPRVPIVVITGVPDEEWALQVIDLGAQDYLFKGEINRHQLIRAIFYAIERQQINDALKTSEIRFRTSVESMLDGFAIYSAVRDESGKIGDYRCEYINASGCRLMLQPKEKLVGGYLSEMLPANKQDVYKDYLTEVVETGVPLIKEITGDKMRDCHQSFTQAISTYDVRAVKLGDGVAILWRDITDQTHAAQSVASHASMMAALYQTSLDITSKLDLNILLRSILERAAILTGTNSGGLYLLNPDGQTLDLVVAYNLPEHLFGTRLQVGEGLSGTIAKTGEPMWVEDYQIWEGKAAPSSISPFKRVFGVPLKVGGKVIGVINLTDTTYVGKYTEEQINLAKLFADQAAIAVENARLHAEVQQLAITDDLTGLYNRRGLFEMGNREVERSLRFRHPLSALMIDLDFYKDVNDCYGHAVGDIVLKAFADRLKENLRGLDILARYGGDEFVVLLLENNLEEAVRIGARLCSAVSETPFKAGASETSLSISLGAAEVDPETKDLSMLIDKADKALYLAKQAGRNRVLRS